MKLPTVDTLMKQLASQRPVFYSEADFQYALAWTLHALLPDSRIRLEYPVVKRKRMIYLDILLRARDLSLAIELKYKTSLLECEHEGEMFSLKDQSAQDVGRYDFVLDIHRLERLKQGSPSTKGWCILLTNDALYWKTPTRSTVDEQFRLHDGRTLSGSPQWSTLASKGTTSGRTRKLDLSGSYPLQWRDYSRVGDGNSATFRYLSVAI